MFCIKYNIIFVKLIEGYIYTGNKIVKLYYTNYKYFKTLKEWNILYKISLLFSNDFNYNQISITVFWFLLYQKREKNNTFYCLNS